MPETSTNVASSSFQTGNDQSEAVTVAALALPVQSNDSTGLERWTLKAQCEHSDPSVANPFEKVLEAQHHFSTKSGSSRSEQWITLAEQVSQFCSAWANLNGTTWTAAFSGYTAGFQRRTLGPGDDRQPIDLTIMLTPDPASIKRLPMVDNIANIVWVSATACPIEISTSTSQTYRGWNLLFSFRPIDSFN